MISPVVGPSSSFFKPFFITQFGNALNWNRRASWPFHCFHSLLLRTKSLKFPTLVLEENPTFSLDTNLTGVVRRCNSKLPVLITWSIWNRSTSAHKDIEWECKSSYWLKHGICVRRGQKMVLSVNDTKHELQLFMVLVSWSCKLLKTKAILKNMV